MNSIMGKSSSMNAKKKNGVGLPFSKKLHDNTVAKATMFGKGNGNKAINSGLSSIGIKEYETDRKNAPKRSLKKKRKRSLVSADDPTYADCFSDTEDAFKQEWNGSSLDEAVKTIMSEGGTLQPSGALLRPGKGVKTKCKTKGALKSGIGAANLKQNCSSHTKQMDLKVPCKNGEEYSFHEVSSASHATCNNSNENCLKTLSPVKKKQKTNACKMSDTATNAGSKIIQPVENEEVSVDRIDPKNCSLSKHKKKAPTSFNSKVIEVKNGLFNSNLDQSCNDAQTEEVFAQESLLQSTKKKKKKGKKSIHHSALDVSDGNDKTDETLFESSNLTPANVDSIKIKAAKTGRGVAADVQVFINNSYSCKSFCKKLRKSWRGEEVEDWPEGSTVLHAPFNCVHLPDFINSDCDLLDRLKKELRSLPFTFRNNDIFKFHQSGELPLSGVCLELRQLLAGPVRDWLLSCTRIPLADTVDLSASLYLHTDALLCHDDELEGRRIAFILYLTDEDDTWQPSDGGSLDLFDGEPGLAGRLVKRLSPHLNTFAFFEVSPLSFHQVSEVLSLTKARLSVSGWFHGPPLEYPTRPIRPPKLFLPPAHVEKNIFFSWVSPVYLAESLQLSIRRQLTQDSEIQLEAFFAPEKFEALSNALRSVETWRWAGPPTSAHYEVCGPTVPDVVLEFLSVMRSEAFFLVLAQLAGVVLHRLAPPDEDGDESCSDAGEDSSDMEDQEADSESEEPKLLTLKRILKGHKKIRNMSDSEKVRSNSSVGLSEKWTYDLGLPRLVSSTCSDLATDTSDVTRNKKKAKKFNKATLERNEAAKSYEETSNSTKISEGNAGYESSASVFSSIRRFSHGCYSLIRDDDNDGGSQGGAKMDLGDTISGGASASQANGCDGRDSTREMINLPHEVEVKTSKKKKLNNPNKKERREDTKAELENEEDNESDADGSYVLDVSLFCNVPDDWSESCGGYTAYVGQHDDEQLLSVVPRNNSLALVYRDHRTHSFIKHINTAAGAASFHQVFCQYKEN